MAKPVLLATDGTPAARGALDFAHALAELRQADLHVFGVVDPIPLFDAGFMTALPEVERFESRQRDLRAVIESQVLEATGRQRAWPVHVQVGVPSTAIVKMAEDIGAGLIVMGLGRHRPVDRVFGTETTLQVLRISHLPVVAVPEGARDLPRSAVFGVDFSEFSLKAAHAAIDVLRRPWEVHLVHVVSGMEFLPSKARQLRNDVRSEALERLGEIAAELPGEARGQVHLHVREGEPAQRLMEFTEGEEGGMIAVGSHGRSFVGRLLVGSVSTRVVRGSTVPVLVMPPPERTQEVFDPGDRTGPGAWASGLNEFTKRNAGRRTTLELEDADGVRWECGRRFPLWGVDYDPRRDRINIMLGHSGTVEGHLTHSLPAPREVGIELDESDRALRLRIVFRTGTAVLRIHHD